MTNHTGYTEVELMKQFMDAYIDHDHIVRWRSNDQIPFQDMLADFRSLGLIDEDAQLGSSLLREKEDEEFWAIHDITKPGEK
jgi:hypothetical protein